MMVSDLIKDIPEEVNYHKKSNQHTTLALKGDRKRQAEHLQIKVQFIFPLCLGSMMSEKEDEKALTHANKHGSDS